MTELKPPAIDPGEVPENNQTNYPEPFRANNQKRFNRRLGERAGLTILRII
jgi:uncharacterized cupin superfamily protein